METIKINR